MAKVLTKKNWKHIQKDGHRLKKTKTKLSHTELIIRGTSSLLPLSQTFVKLKACFAKLHQTAELPSLAEILCLRKRTLK